MRSSVYSTQPAALRFLVFLGCLLLTACGSSKKSAGVSTSTKSGRDGGQDDNGGLMLDGNVPLPRGPGIDAAALLPGEPPPELAGQPCAVDTNKLYTLATTMRQPEPTALAVDLINSQFGLAYLDKSPKCLDAIFVAELHGASGLGMPEVSMAMDNCTTIDHAAITHNGDAWLLASVDARKDQRDLWVQAYAKGAGASDPHRITTSLGQKREVALAALGTDAAVTAWVEADMASGKTALYVRLLSPQGEPMSDAVTIEESDSLTFAGLALAPIGDSLIGFGYRRFDMAKRSEIVLQMLDAATGKPDRDAWVLTTDGGTFGSVDISADQDGGGVIYSIVQGTSEQLWFQRLDKTGHAAAVTSGGRTGGPMDPARVVGPPYNALDASLAKLPNGFAVAYRALPGGAIKTPRIRVHFIDRFGRVIGDSDVALAQSYGGRTAIDAAYDGRIVIAWSDQDEKGKTTTTAVKMPCVGGI